jgi:hypothetical protein
MTIKAVLLTLTLLISLRVFALSGNRWPLIIDQLEATGISKIGQLDLRQFRAAAARVRWSEISEAPESVQSGSRESAYYESGRVHMAPTDTNSASLPQLELHEVFGALGYDDSNYQLSSALEQLASMPDSSERRRLVSVWGRSLFSRRFRVAGGTSVTGGGDLGAVSLKSQVLKLILNEGRVVRETFVNIYPRIAFEPSRVNRVSLQYLSSQSANRRSKSESMTILFPRGSNDPGLVQEIARKITEIFPAYDGQETETFRPSLCSSGTVTFPKTNDPSVRDIQDSRGARLLGCDLNERNVVSRRMLSPALPSEEARPREAGNYYFNCVLSYQGQEFSAQVVSQRGVSQFAANVFSIDGASMVHGFTPVTREGALQGIGLRVTGLDGRVYPLVMKRADSATAGTVETTVNGASLRYACQRNR